VDVTAEHEMTCVKLRSMQSGYHQVITVAAELVQTLASCINGEKITPSYLGDIAKRLSSLRKAPPAMKQQSDGAISVKGTIHKPVIPPVSPNTSSTIDRLDFGRIKNELAVVPQDTEGANREASLIQALSLVY
jgi:hypothetical protein